MVFFNEQVAPKRFRAQNNLLKFFFTPSFWHFLPTKPNFPTLIYLKNNAIRAQTEIKKRKKLKREREREVGGRKKKGGQQNLGR